METSANNFIARLQEIRNTLMDAVQSNRALASKLVGPRPSDSPKQIGQAPNSVDLLLVEIGSLSIELAKITSMHHETLGSFAPGNPAGACAESRSYA